VNLAENVLLQSARAQFGVHMHERQLDNWFATRKPSLEPHVAVATDDSAHEAMGAHREERTMRNIFLASASAVALIAGGTLAVAQGTGREAPSPAPGPQQSAPAEKMAPGGGAQQPQRSPDSGTTGQRSPESGTTGQGAPSGAREGQDRMKSGDPKGGDKPSATEAPGDRRGTTGQGDRPGAREGQDRMKSGDPKAGDQKGDRPSATEAPGGQRGTTSGQGPAGAGGASLTQEQRSKITTTIKQTNVRPVTEVNFNVAVGTTVPRTVELHPLPPTVIEVYPQWRGYRFVLVKDEIVIIEPDTYRIVAVIEA